jgi:hypothetical protein
LKFVGQKTVQDEAADCVDVLLRMKSSVDDIVVNAFENHRQFSEGAKVAFEMFINTSKNNRIAELIAKFMDEKLKKGNKTSLSTEKDLDEQLNKAVALFRFIQGKDVFEAFYKKDLAKRLLFSKSASIDAERLVVGKLRSECGANFTTRLEGMFKDVDVSRDVQRREFLEFYQRRLSARGLRQGFLDLFRRTDGTDVSHGGAHVLLQKGGRRRRFDFRRGEGREAQSGGSADDFIRVRGDDCGEEKRGDKGRGETELDETVVGRSGVVVLEN